MSSNAKGKSKEVNANEENANEVNANEVNVSVAERNSKKSTLKKLYLNQKLSKIREELEKFTINKVSFYRKLNDEEFDDINENDEGKFSLEDVITFDNDIYTLYIKKRIYWDTLNDNRQLDFGRTMSFDGIKVAEKRAFIMKNCELKEFGANGIVDRTIEFDSKEDLMKKTNLFFSANIDVQNFVGLGFSVESSKDKNYSDEIASTYHCKDYKKVSLKFREYLELTEEFQTNVEKAIDSKDLENFRNIIKNYGRFISTKVVLGGRVYSRGVKKSSVIAEISDTKVSVSATGSAPVGPGVVGSVEGGFGPGTSKNKSESRRSGYTKIIGGKCDGEFDENVWIESLKDYRNWDCIEFSNPVSIFQLLPNDLRKKTFKLLGKKVLYTAILDNVDYHLSQPGSRRKLELPDILENEEAECDIFAAVVDADKDSKDIFLNCQVLRLPDKKPSLIIRGIQKKFQIKTFKLKIRLMVVGYDTDFKFDYPDINVELINKPYENSQNRRFDSIILPFSGSLLEGNVHYLGIPVLNESKSSIIIGHNFCETANQLRVDVFSYCLEANSYVELPKFTFCALFITNNSTSSTSDIPAGNFTNFISNISTKKLQFKFKLFKKPFIDLSQYDNNPKYVSLNLSKAKRPYRPIFLNQKPKRIRVKYINCNCNEAESVDCICNKKTKKLHERDHCTIFNI